MEKLVVQQQHGQDKEQDGFYGIIIIAKTHIHFPNTLFDP